MFETDDAAFAPDDTSKSPETATFNISELGITAHSVPDRAEKVITQAQTTSILLADLEIDSVIIAETGIRGVFIGILTVLSAFFFLNGLPIIPTAIADKSMHTYIVIPIFRDESIEPPTPPITKAADGTFINVNISSNSFFDISPLSKASAALIAPTGYPQRNPSAIGQAAPLLVPNIHFRGILKKEPSSVAHPLTIIRDEMSIKGKTAGITVFIHRAMPLFTYSADTDEPKIPKIITADHNIGTARCSFDFVRTYLTCILASPRA